MLLGQKSQMWLLVSVALLLGGAQGFTRVPGGSNPLRRGATLPQAGRKVASSRCWLSKLAPQRERAPGATIRRELETLRLGAVNKTIPLSELDRVMVDASIDNLIELHQRQRVEEQPEDSENAAYILTSLTGPSAMHPVFSRWELSFLSLKSLPTPFYVPFENIITLSRDGPMRIEATVRLFDVEVPLGTFTILENSTRAGTVPLREGEAVLYGLQLESIKPGTKVFDLMVYQTDEHIPVLAVKSTDGEEAWLLTSIEARMRRREENIRKYAREILSLESSASRSGDGGQNMAGYMVMREVWKKVFSNLDNYLGTNIASNTFIVGVAPLFPVIAIGLFVLVNAYRLHNFGDMNFLLR